MKLIRNKNRCNNLTGILTTCGKLWMTTRRYELGKVNRVFNHKRGCRSKFKVFTFRLSYQVYHVSQSQGSLERKKN